jgi:hypothetical protein
MISTEVPLSQGTCRFFSAMKHIAQAHDEILRSRILRQFRVNRSSTVGESLTDTSKVQPFYFNRIRKHIKMTL